MRWLWIAVMALTGNQLYVLKIEWFDGIYILHEPSRAILLAELILLSIVFVLCPVGFILSRKGESK